MKSQFQIKTKIETYVQLKMRPNESRHIQAEGAQLFNQFNKRIRQVDEALFKFGNAVRPLAACVGLISSTYNLRARLQQILHLFRENAAECFPDKLKKEPVKPTRPFSDRKRNAARSVKFGHKPTWKIIPTTPLTSDLEEFPTQLLLLAKDLVSFLLLLHNIPEFTDQNLNASVLSFKADLEYWASCLCDFEGQFGFPAVKRHVNDLAQEMDEHLETMRDALKLFVQDGVGIIRAVQKDAQTSLQNLSTVAAFISGVTATTIQYTSSVPDTSLQKAMNALWTSSLVFSIASSINSQLVYQWRVAMYRSPHNELPWWVTVCLMRTPFIFLIISVVLFSAGLVTFSFASGQGALISTCCTVFTSVTWLPLLAVGLWLAGERIVFERTKGNRWLSDVLRDLWKKFTRRTGLDWLVDVVPRKIKSAATWSSEKFLKAGAMAYEVGTNVLGRISATVPPHGGSSTSGDSCDDRDEYVTDGGVLPVALNSPRSMHARRLSEASAGSAKSRRTLPSPIHPVLFEDQLPVSSPSDDMHSGPFSPPAPSTLLPTPPEEPGSSRSPISPAVSPARALFGAQVQKVMKSQLLARPMKSPSSFVPNTPRKSSTIRSAPERKGSNTEEKFALRPSRLAVVIPKLKKLQPTQHLIEHLGLVRHLQFSPDGKWLATCSWDKTAIIWKVGEPFQPHKILAHPGAGFISQVAWSPDGGKYLLTKMHKAVKVWMADTGVLFRTINREHQVAAVTWLPSGKAFASVEHDNIYIVDLQGTVLDSHCCGQMRIEIHDVSFTPDEERMLLVGTLKISQMGLQPSKSRAEKRILVYDLVNKEVENQVPVLENVRNVSIGSDGFLALVSYEDRAPPEVWAIDIVANEGQLRLLNTYIPPTPVDFAGPSYFGGVKDQFVICAGKKGDIHIWDRETGLLLHSLQGANIVDGGAEDLTGIAWNHYVPGQYMFASATQDGTVRIWTAQAPPEMAPPSQTGSPGPMGRIRDFNTGGISGAT